ncbi:MAG: hypothetical protein M5R41_07760 [Bacteroidia bacterium]|nr:hypothetical protein [Bacteroidia bacterium]
MIFEHLDQLKHLLVAAGSLAWDKGGTIASSASVAWRMVDHLF